MEKHDVIRVVFSTDLFPMFLQNVCSTGFVIDVCESELFGGAEISLLRISSSFRELTSYIMIHFVLEADWHRPFQHLGRSTLIDN